MPEEIINEATEIEETVSVEETETETTETAEETVVETNPELENLKSENEKLLGQIQEMQNTLSKYISPEEKAKMDKEYTQKLNKIKVENAINLKLNGNEYAGIIKKEINVNNISLTEEGNVIGLDLEVNRVKEIYPKLFTTETVLPSPTPNISTGVEQTSVVDKNEVYAKKGLLFGGIAEELIKGK